jgi:ribosomal protein S18 acetylase RimI-like enzyme
MRRDAPPGKAEIAVVLRQAEPADASNLAELASKTYTETFGHSLGPAELRAELERTKSARYFKSILGADTVLVVEEGGRLAGYIQIGSVRIEILDGEPASVNDQAINAIYVHSDFQGRGFGKALMSAALDHPRVREARNVYIDVWAENKRALSLYRKCGFRPVGKCEFLIAGKLVGHDLVLRRKVRLVG